MIVNCESCQTSFTLDERLVKPTGSKVRCSKCAHVFRVFPLAAATAVEPVVSAPVEGAPDAVASQPSPETEKDGYASGGDAAPADDGAGGETARTATGKPSVSDELDQLFKEVSAERIGPPVPSLQAQEGDLSLEALQMNKDGEIGDLSMEDVDRFLSLDASIDLDAADLSVASDVKTHEAATAVGEKKKPDDASKGLSAPLEFDDLDLRLEPDDFSQGDIEEDLQLEMDLDLKRESGTEVSTELRRTEEQNGDIEPAELDLSELDLFFDGKGPAASKEPALEASLVGLDLPGEKASGAGQAEEFDLDNVNATLDLEAGASPDSAGEANSGKIDVDKEPEDDGFDLDELEKLISESPDETIAGKAAAATAGAVAAGVAAASDGKAEPAISAGAREQEPKSPKAVEPVPRKAKSRLPLLLLLSLLLLAAGAYVLNRMGVEIPLLDAVMPSADPAGILHIQTTGDPETKFIENQKQGRLFVISGKVTNHYPRARGMIRVKADIITPGPVVAQTQTVSCGNMLTDEELATLDLETIMKQLANPSGANNSNLKIEPGKSVPYMIVFSNLPENLEAFELEVSVAGSRPAS